MAAPIIDSVTFDKASYTPGAKVTATIKYHDPDAKTFTFTGTVTDAESHATSGIGSFSVADPCTTSGADDGGRTWAKVSDDTVGTAVYSATA